MCPPEQPKELISQLTICWADRSGVKNREYIVL